MQKNLIERWITVSCLSVIKSRNKITLNYPEAMIAKVEEFGPFINLGKGTPFRHARLERRGQ